MNIPNYKFALREDLKDDKRFLPTKAESKASGWDVRAAHLTKRCQCIDNGEMNMSKIKMEEVNSLLIKPFEYVKIPLGFRAFCPEGWWYELRPRSSSFAKKNLHALHGVIDQDFENQLVFAAQYIPDPNVKLNPTLVIEFGEAIGQIIPVKLQEMSIEQITNEEYDALCLERKGSRGTGGFGTSKQ